MVKRPLLASLLLVIASAIAFVGLTTTRVSAGDSTVDDVTLTIPVACTLSSTLDAPHSATINNGTYTSDIGTTTFTTFCNDSEGYSIYAIGYSNETDGNNKLLATVGGVLTPSSDISTGTATSGNTSAWAMKLNPVTGTYAPTIASDTEGSYSSYHTIPSTNTKVATLTSSTDFTIGSSFQSTYRTYISPTQLSGTYNGKVKYTLVHPNYVDSQAIQDAITVVYDGNGLTFPNGQTTNTVKYANVCSPGGYGYVGSTYQEVMTSNIDPGGDQDGPYSDSEDVLQTVNIPGADKVKVEVRYGISDGDTAELDVVGGTWDGDWDTLDEDQIVYDTWSTESISGTKTYIINDDTVTIKISSWGTPETGYDYGFYVKVYPVYDTEQPGTTIEELPSNDCAIYTIVGNYTEPNSWNGQWTIEEDGDIYSFIEENGIKEELAYNYDSLKGTTITLKAYNPYTLTYNGNGASSDFGMDVQKTFDRDYGYLPEEIGSGYKITLLAPNYKRTGYGFVGWSTDQNAGSHLSTATIYGPNQTITVDDTLLGTADSSHLVTLYAIWLSSSGSIQNWSGCSTMNIGNIVALTDTRDSNTYTVAKLEDGNCWMTENLRLGGSNSMNLSTNNTQSAGTLPASAIIWQDTSDTAQNLDAENTLNPPRNVDYARSRNYAFGNYYSWATAINSTSNYYNETISGSSICPAGWELPTGSNYGVLNDLLYDYSTSNIIRSYPNNFIFSGLTTGTVNSPFNNYTQGVNLFGNYWTSSSDTIMTARQEIITFNDAHISGNGGQGDYASQSKDIGRAIRCFQDMYSSAPSY